MDDRKTEENTPERHGDSAPAPSQSASQKPAHRRLSQAAAAVLENHWTHVSKEPTLEERQELLRKVHSMPGMDWYTMVNVRSWFKTRREAEAKRKALKMERTGLILWPSLDHKKIAKLKILYEENPDPDQVALEVWSRALAAERTHVENWLQMNGGRGRDSLPTPETSASPEPLSPQLNSTSTFHSPILGPPRFSPQLSSTQYYHTFPLPPISPSATHLPGGNGLLDGYSLSHSNFNSVHIQVRPRQSSPVPIKAQKPPGPVVDQFDAGVNARKSIMSAPSQSPDTSQQSMQLCSPINIPAPAPNTSPQPREQSTSSVAPPPPVNKFRDLVMFIRSRVQEKLADDQGLRPEAPLEDLSKRMDINMAFLEKIERGDYASLGLHAASND